MKPINPELEPVRVYNENGMAVICVKRQPSISLSHFHLAQVQYLLTVDPSVFDIAAYLARELGEDARKKLFEAVSKAGIFELPSEDTGEAHGV